LSSLRLGGGNKPPVSRSAARPKVTESAAVRAVAERVGTTPAQVGLAWLLAHRDNVLLIPGTSSVAHLEENMHVANVTLSDDDIADLEKGV